MKKTIIIFAVFFAVLQSSFSAPENLLQCVVYDWSLRGSNVVVNGAARYSLPKHVGGMQGDNWFWITNNKIQRWDAAKMGYAEPTEAYWDSISIAAKNWHSTTNIPAIRFKKADGKYQAALIRALAAELGITASSLRSKIKAQIRP